MPEHLDHNAYWLRSLHVHKGRLNVSIHFYEYSTLHVRKLLIYTVKHGYNAQPEECHHAIIPYFYVYYAKVFIFTVFYRIK